MINTSLEASGTSNAAAENRHRYICKARVQYFRTDIRGPMDQYCNATDRKDAASLSAITPSMNGIPFFWTFDLPIFYLTSRNSLRRSSSCALNLCVPFSPPVRAQKGVFSNHPVGPGQTVDSHLLLHDPCCYLLLGLPVGLIYRHPFHLIS